MNLVEVILMFVVAPLVIIGIAYVLGALMSRKTTSKNLYKLGDEWDRGPLWFVGKPNQSASIHHAAHDLDHHAEPAASTTVVGGASGTW